MTTMMTAGRTGRGTITPGGLAMLAVYAVGLFLMMPAAPNPACAAGNEPADYYMNRGIEQYIKGDLDAAIRDFQDAYSFTPDNKKIKTLLLQALMDRAKQCYEQKQYRQAKVYLDKYKSYDPTNDQALAMLENIEKQLGTPPPAPVPPPQPAVSPVAAPETPIGTVRTPKVTPRTYDTYRPPAVSRNPALEAELRNKDAELQKALDAAEREKAQTRQNLYLMLAGTFVLIGAILAIGWRFLRGREQEYRAQQERIMNMVFEQNRALAQGGTRIAAQGEARGRETITMEEMLGDPNARVRARGIEMVEHELAEQNPEMAQKILEPFLRDRHNRVRANAAKAIYRFSPNLAMSTLSEMATSADKWMRVSCAYALGELAIPECVELLRLLAVDPDNHVRRRTMAALRKIKELRAASLPDKTIRTIDAILEDQPAGHGPGAGSGSPNKF